MPCYFHPSMCRAALAAGALLLALTPHAQAHCEFQSGHSGQISFAMDMGTLWMPRDLPDGQEIASVERVVSSPNKANCFYEATREVRAELINTAPMVLHSLPATRNRSMQYPVLQTRVPGIGVTIALGTPYDGALVANSNRFIADPGTLTAIPYRGGLRRQTVFATQMGDMRVKLTLVKTGPIAPGPQTIDEELFHGILDQMGKVLDFRLKTTVNHAQCSLRADAVSADPVQLGDYSLADFPAPPGNARRVPFHIRLNDCQDDGNASAATAYIRLDGIRGSAPVDRALGLFSLTSNSTATGIGIQMQRADGTPMPLEQEVPVKRLNIGITQLDFQARFYQTAAKVTPGLAEGALNFTVSYQ